MARRTKRRRLMAKTILNAGVRGIRKFGSAVYKRAKNKVVGRAADAALNAPTQVYKAAKRKIQDAKGRIKSAKRKLNFGTAPVGEGQSLKMTRVKHINLGGRGQIKSISKAVRPLWAKHLFEYTNGFRALETTVMGFHVLNTINDSVLPLHCWDLTYISQMKHPTDAFFCGIFKQNGVWDNAGFSNTLRDVDTGPGTGAHFNRCTKWLHRTTKIRLLLYGRPKSSTTYRIIFFRCRDEENCPNRSDIHFDRDEINKNIWFNKLARFTTNPITIGHNATNFRQGRKHGADIQIIRSFDYNIAEQLSTEDAIRKVNVNFTCHINKIKTHNEANVDKPVYNDITGIVPQLNTHTYDNATQTVLPQQRLYMAIMATNYTTEGELNYQPPSYDMSMLQYIDASNLHGWPE